MKRIAAMLLASSLMLCGCAAKTSDGKQILASVDGLEITCDSVYEDLYDANEDGSTLFGYIIDQLIDEKFPITKNMKEDAKERVESIEENFESNYGDDYETYLESALASSGYATLDAYEEALVQALQYTEFLKDYVKNNFDEVYDDYYSVANPRMISIIKVSVSDFDSMTDDEISKLDEVEALLNTSKKFGDIAKDYSDDDSASSKGSIGVVDSYSEIGDTYGDNVEETALSLKEGEISGAIEGDDGYYFIYCTSTSKKKIKKELSSVDIESPLLTYDDYLVYLAYNSYDITINDKTLAKKIKTYVSDALKDREEERSDD